MKVLLNQFKNDIHNLYGNVINEVKEKNKKNRKNIDNIKEHIKVHQENFEEFNKQVILLYMYYPNQFK